MPAIKGISDIHTSESSDRARYLGLGAKAIRVEFHGDIINPKSGVWNWSIHDSIVNWGIANNVPILGILNRCPAWAFADHATFLQYVTNLAAALTSRYSSASVPWWEPFNEPNHMGDYVGWPYWNVNPNNLVLAATRYADAVKAFRAGAPGAFSVIGSMMMPSGNNGYPPVSGVDGNGIYQGWLREVLTRLAPTDYDAVSLHRYGPGVNLLGDQAAVQTVCSQVGHPTNRKLWITERGQPDNFAIMSQVMDETFTASNVNGLGAIFWFSERDNQATGEKHGVFSFSGSKRTSQYNKLKGYL